MVMVVMMVDVLHFGKLREIIDVFVQMENKFFQHFLNFEQSASSPGFLILEKKFFELGYHIEYVLQPVT